ncbi:MAG TPA: hypothetical protein VLG16_04200 [Candidatus Saccharimonadales bacterium]|nr:hypothetical protein [Candidatus Saccharimonadales bacterium]
MTTPEQNQLPDITRPSLLDGMFSIEYPDCSIAAADLCRVATECLSNVTDRQDIYIAGADDNLQSLVWKKLGARNGKASKFTLNGFRAELLLVQPTVQETIEPREPEPTQRQRRIARRALKKEVTTAAPSEGLQEIRVGDPLLAVYFGDTVLPIASFARREEGGMCSYVQLGLEMEDGLTDDDLYATTTDDATPRFEIIEALRKLVDDTIANSHFGTVKPQDIAIVQAFIDRQAIVRGESVAKAYEAQLVRRCYEKVEKGKQLRLNVLEEDAVITPADHQVTPIIAPVVQEDGRLVSLVMARDTQSEGALSDSLKLYALTRGDIAVPVASLSRTFGTVDFQHEGQLTVDDRAKLLRDLLYTVRDRAEANTPKIDDAFYVQSEKTPYDMLIKDTLVSQGLLDRHARFDNFDDKARRPGLTRPDAKYYEMTKRILPLLGRYFAYPDLNLPAHIADSAPLKVAAQTLVISHTRNRNLLSRLPISDLLSERLGDVRKCDEIFMHYVTAAQNATQELQANLHNQPIGKTKADVTIKIELDQQGTLYNLTLLGRPKAMENEPMKSLLNVVFDSSQQNLGGGRLLGNPEVVDEISTILQTVLLDATEAE